MSAPLLVQVSALSVQRSDVAPFIEPALALRGLACTRTCCHQRPPTVWCTGAAAGDRSRPVHVSVAAVAGSHRRLPSDAAALVGSSTGTGAGGDRQYLLPPAFVTEVQRKVAVYLQRPRAGLLAPPRVPTYDSRLHSEVSSQSLPVPPMILACQWCTCMVVCLCRVVG